MAIRPRERTAIIQSLSAGVVPSIGLQHIQVGRHDEVAALVNDLKLVEEGSSTIRFVIGRFGSGKTFFLNVVRTVALSRRFVVLQGDITTERRLHGSAGQARSMFAELTKNLATNSRPEGGALSSLVERWIGDLAHNVLSAGGEDADVCKEITRQLEPLRALANGYDFSTVLARYYEGYRDQNEQLQQAACRWLRAEYDSKQQARHELGVRSIIDDDSFYDSLKLISSFVRLAGYAGMLVCFDELVVLTNRLNNTIARNNNYEAILHIVNDSLQGQTGGLAFLFAGTDECLEDRRRGLFSYEALATRLAPNQFAISGKKDLSHPVIKLDGLTPEDCFALLYNIRNVFAAGDPAKHLVPDDAITEFLNHCFKRMGAACFQTPRDTAMGFTGFLRVLEQNPDANWKDVLSRTSPRNETSPGRDALPSKPGDDLAEFRL